MTPYIDLVRLALKTTTGTIPSSIPAHYVRWAYWVHVTARNPRRAVGGGKRGRQ